MTKLRICGTALAALIISSVPALALYDEENPGCDSEICTTTDTSHMTETNRGATVIRQGRGPVTVQLPNSARAENPTGRAQDRRSGKGGGAGGGDDIEGCDFCQD